MVSGRRNTGSNQVKNSRANYMLIAGAALVLAALGLLVTGCSDEEATPVTPEPVDDPRSISLERTDWSWAGVPFLGEGYLSRSGDQRTFDPVDRVEAVRWFLPKQRTLARYQDPDLTGAARDRTRPTLDLYLRADDGTWDPEDWGGITTGFSRTGRDLSTASYLEIWINDGEPDRSLRQGRLHLDFGFIDEDGFWPLDNDGNLQVGTHEMEDGILPGDYPDGVFIVEEDIGLDGDENGPQRFDAAYEIAGDTPYPRINGTARNGREDDEDVNGDGRLYRDSGYFTTTIDLKETESLVEVVYDYGDVQDLMDANISWRKYRITLTAVDSVSVGIAANIRAVTHVRVWYENPAQGASPVNWLQFSGLRFVENAD
mgnify:CR=1 FL=1